MLVPDAIDPAVGYRAWIVRGTALFSVVHTVEWQPDMVFEAFCASCGDDVPGVKHSCGTYATASFDRLFNMGYARQSGLFAAPGEITIAGQVSLWGGIVPGQYGWRAQFAYPKKLLIPYTQARIAVPLAERYGVPFKLYNLERKHPIRKAKK